MSVQIPKIRNILADHQLHANKSFGQHFLTDNHVLSKIIDAAELTKDDFVIEIGAGLGSLTWALCENAGFVASYEIDSNLLPILEESLSEYDNLKIIHEDILVADIAELIRESGYKRCKIVANLPYYITTPIIFRVFDENLPVESMVLMVQKEVGGRLTARPSSKEYGALTVSARYYAETSIVANVPKHSFVPRPDIESTVVKFTLRDDPSVSVSDKPAFMLTVKAAFSKRRKTLVNCLASFDGFGKYSVTKQQAIEIVRNCDFDENIRGEALAIEDFAKLSNELYRVINKVPLNI